MTEQTPEAATGAIEQVFPFNQQTFDTLSQACAAMFNTCVACSRETSDLISRRQNAYATLPGQLGLCSTVHEVIELQGRFLQTMIRDYTEQARNISGLLSELPAIGVEQAEERLSPAEGDVAAATPRKERASELAQRAA